MTYIIAQVILARQEQIGNTLNNYWENIIRKVEAENKESAIGKFVLQTANIPAKEKLGIDCIKLDELVSLN